MHFATHELKISSKGLHISNEYYKKLYNIHLNDADDLIFDEHIFNPVLLIFNSCTSMSSLYVQISFSKMKLVKTSLHTHLKQTNLEINFIFQQKV